VANKGAKSPTAFGLHLAKALRNFAKTVSGFCTTAIHPRHENCIHKFVFTVSDVI